MRFDMRMLLQRRVNRGPETPGAVAVHDPDFTMTGQPRVIEKLVELVECFLHPGPDQLELGGRVLFPGALESDTGWQHVRALFRRLGAFMLRCEVADIHGHLLATNAKP